MIIELKNKEYQIIDFTMTKHTDIIEYDDNGIHKFVVIEHSRDKYIVYETYHFFETDRASANRLFVSRLCGEPYAECLYDSPSAAHEIHKYAFDVSIGRECELQEN